MVADQPLFGLRQIGFGLVLRARLGYLGSMQVRYFPTRLGLGQDDRPSIEKSGPVIQVEGRNRKIPEHLKLHVLWLDVHIRGCRFPAANLLEDHFESFFKFSTSVCALRKCSRIEHGSVVIEGQTESLPVKVIEGVNEFGEGLPDLRFG